MQRDSKSAPWVCGPYKGLYYWHKRFDPDLAVGIALERPWGTLEDAKTRDDRSHQGYDRRLCQRGNGVEKANPQIRRCFQVHSQWYVLKAMCFWFE
tara:strand:- start:262 stop:549 length:288 start_codon:yes stop_codon:yes gene_type:complete